MRRNICKASSIFLYRNVRLQTTVSTSKMQETEKSEAIIQEVGINPAPIPFSRAKIGTFFQDPPKLGNTYVEDTVLKSYLKRVLPEKIYQQVAPELEDFGLRAGTELNDLSKQCEQNQPFVKQYDAYGRRIDELVTSDAWKQQKKVTAEEGIIATAYERKHGEWSRLHQMAKMYLYAPSSGLYSCPIAMTDGAAKIAEVLGKPGPLNEAFDHLTSRDPNKFWTSGQWMTERKGGSDVANGTETVAVLQMDGTYRLYGYKWFSSATDSDMSITLARKTDSSGQLIKGTKGLSMFYLETKDRSGKLNNMQVVRLKDKLGTRQLPTAELLLDGVVAHKISEDGRGVPGISSMLTVTRIHNAVASVSAIRRMLMLSRDFCTKRMAFGRLIKDHPIHIKTLADMEIEARGGMMLIFEISQLLGRDDCNIASAQENDLLRLLTPIAKLYTAKQAMKCMSEGLESFGGIGYLEDTDLPRMLRDAQVLPIWEGTTNILSIDVLRAIGKSQGAVLAAFHKNVMNKISEANSNPKLEGSIAKISHALGNLINFASQHPSKLELAARDFAFSLGKTYIGALLVEHANWSEASAQDVLAANRWCEKQLESVTMKYDHGNYETSVNSAEYQLVFDGYEQQSKL